MKPLVEFDRRQLVARETAREKSFYPYQGGLRVLPFAQLRAFKTKWQTVDMLPREVMLYALAVGAGNDLPNTGCLPFVFEKNLAPLATFFSIITSQYPTYLKDLRISVPSMLHIGETLEVIKLPPVSGSVSVEGRVGKIIDKGAKRGAIVDIEFDIRDAGSEERLARSVTRLYCRGDGGIEGAPEATAEPAWSRPDRPPTGSLSVPTRSDQAALYRLCGDMNPIHIDPTAAAEAGFDRPLLHGLCTYGMAYTALLRELFGGDPRAITRFSCRFLNPVYPGDRMEIDYWAGPGDVQFQINSEGSRRVLEGSASIAARA